MNVRVPIHPFTFCGPTDLLGAQLLDSLHNKSQNERKNTTKRWPSINYP